MPDEIQSEAKRFAMSQELLESVEHNEKLTPLWKQASIRVFLSMREVDQAVSMA